MMMMFCKQNNANACAHKSNVSFSSHHPHFSFTFIQYLHQKVWDIFLYDALNSVNSNEQQALMNAHRTGDYATKQALHEKYYTQTSTALLEHIENFIEDIDKLIHKAETIGVNDQNSPYIKYEHPRLPLIHRHNLFVRETFQAV